MATQLRLSTPAIPPIPAELEAMSRAWDSMADAFFDLESDRYERAKNEFEMLNRGFRNDR